MEKTEQCLETESKLFKSNGPIEMVGYGPDFHLNTFYITQLLGERDNDYTMETHVYHSVVTKLFHYFQLLWQLAQKR